VASPIANFGSGVASALYTFAGLILVSAVVAFLAARKWGRTKRAREAIYGIVGFVGLAIATASFEIEDASVDRPPAIQHRG
jgi:hypothetical protein